MSAADLAGYVAIGAGAAVVVVGIIRNDSGLITLGAGLLGGPAVVKGAGGKK